jgi:hypothetical protein
MTIHTTDSTVIRQVAYEPGTVYVTFRSGAEYMYRVPRKRAFTNFIKAPSVGRYFNRYFKKNYGPGDCIS